MTKYITKKEVEMSRLLQAVNEQVISLSKMEKLNAFASVLDRSREVSIQEAV